MTAIQILTAWLPASILILAIMCRFLFVAHPVRSHDRQHGEGERVRGDVQSHNGVISRG